MTDIRLLIDEHHANAISEYKRLGSPDTPSDAERFKITLAARLSTESIEMQNGELTLTLAPNSVALIEL